MKVSYSVHQEQKDVLLVQLDDEPWKLIHIAIYGRRPSLPSGCQTLSDFENMMADLEFNSTKKFMYKRLAAKSLHSTELIKLLKERLISDVIIRRLITDFRQLGYLDDKAWIDQFIRSQKARNQGSRLILLKLKMKGISTHELDLSSEEDEIASVQRLLETRYRNRDLTNLKEKQKIISALMRKGFKFDHIKQGLSMLVSQE